MRRTFRVIIIIGVCGVKPSDRHAISACLGRGAAAGLLILALAEPSLAGPWTRTRGGHYARFSASYLYTDTEYDYRGNEVPLLTSNPLVQSAAYREVDFSAYVEYGLTDRLSVVGALPFKILTSRRTEISDLADLIREVDVTSGGLSDLSAGVRQALTGGRWPVSLEVMARVPLGYDATPDNGAPALGTGHADLSGALLAGTSARGMYVTASAAYRVRGGPLADDAGFAAQVGGSRGRVSGQALLEGWYSTVDPQELDVSSTMAVPNQDILKLIVSLGWQWTPQSAVVAEVYHVLDAKNAPAGTTAALGLVLTR
jgi:hypothetical protein